MATIQDYVSGKVCELIEQAFSIFKSVGSSLNKSDIDLQYKSFLNSLDL